MLVDPVILCVVRVDVDSFNSICPVGVTLVTVVDCVSVLEAIFGADVS